ncbi:hypothetical protein TCSYLVIO_001314 [Trypanosoma cruzi]|nr:hypothetical protein TCSYLVIO_001314 [Trypanosoma cruzi]
MTDTGEVHFVLRAEGCIHSSDVRHVSCSSGVLLTASRDNTAMILPEQPPNDTITSGLVLVGHTEFVNFVTFHPFMALLDGESCIVTGSNDKHVALWNPVTTALEAVLDGHAHGVCCGVVMLPNSGDIVTGDWGGMCIVFDNTTGGVKQNYTGHKTAVRAVAQLPGTSSVVSASGDKTIHQWDVETGATLSVFVGHEDVVQCICAMSATRFATGGNDANIMIWDTEKGTTPLRLLTAHDSLIYALCYCPTRQLLFSVSEDRSLKVWQGGVLDLAPSSTQTESVVIQSINHPCVVWSVCFTSTGDVVTGGSDGVVRMWTADDGMMASVEKLETLEAAVAAQTIDVKVLTVAGIDTASMLSVADLRFRKGTHQGERLIARAEAGTIEVYAWNCGRWDKVGTVVEGPQGQAFTGAAQPREKKYLNGVPHDYIFDVDVNGKMLKLSYDKGQSIFEAAQNFINENHTLVSQSHREEIQNFILNNVDPRDIQPGTGTANAVTGAGNHASASASAAVGGGGGEPVFSEYAREAAALQQAGVSTTPTWGEALRNMETVGASRSDVAFSGYAREGLLLEQEAARRAGAPPATAEEANRSIVRWNNHKRFTSYNAAGAKKKIDELTGNTRLSALVERVVTAAEGEPNSALLDDIAALYRELPEAFRFPALDLLSHLLAVTVHPFGWLQLLLSDDGNGGDAPNARAFFEECIQNLPHVPDVEALVTTRLFAHVIAALDKPPPGAKLTADQLALILAMLTKAPQSLLQTKNSNVKTAICALLQNAAVLLAGDPVVLGKDGASDATRGVMRLLAQLLLFESISSSHTRDLVATVMTLMLSDGSGKDIQTSVVAVEVGRNTLAHTLRALKAGPEPHCREAAIKLLHCLDDAELQ